MAKKSQSAAATEELHEDVENVLYEICVLIPTNLGQKGEKETIDAIEKLFAEAQGTQVAVDHWGRRGLAYKIAGHEEAKFIIYHYEIPPHAVRELDAQLRITSGVLRHMIIKPPKGYEIVKYSEIYTEWQQNRDSREEESKEAKEEELKKKVVAKARRKVSRAEEEAKDAPKEEVKTEEVAEGLDKLISDEDLDL